MSLASTLLVSSIPILIGLYSSKYQRQDFKETFPNDPHDFGLPIPQEFDYIIVGGGTAGCILGNRLSVSHNTLILEVGGNPPPLQAVPYIWKMTAELPEINFVYKSVPQKNSALAHGGLITISTGKMMGGSSSHNAMTYERGNLKDYDRWANETQDESWKYENLLKYFIKSEHYTGRLGLSKTNHGGDGPMRTAEDEFSPGKEIWLQAAQELGYHVIDSNGPQSEGFSQTLETKRNGRRDSVYTAYIEPVEEARDNLTVYRYSNVTEIIFDDKKAIGVRFTRHGVPQVAFARRKIILSAGAIGTPLLLMKSGIVPDPSQLKFAGSKLVTIIPGVGQNLLDHPMSKIAPIYVNQSQLSWHLETNLTFKDVRDFIDHGKGPLSSGAHGSMAAFLTSKQRILKGEPNWPDLQLYYSYVAEGEPNSVTIAVGFNDQQSMGSVTLGENGEPLIDFNFFADPHDLEVAIEGLHLALKIVENTTAFQSIGAHYSSTPSPYCEHLTFRSDEYFKCFVRQFASSTAHLAGTCKMGRKGDPMAVVDSKLRVIGIENLMIVDASIMPFVTNANLMAVVMAIAEKTADEILEERGEETILKI